jgi:hypothetical protein
MKRSHWTFLTFVYLLGLFLRIYPRLSLDPHLLTFQGDIWYRLAMAQYVMDNIALPNPDLRYLAYGNVPMWYPPISPLFLAGLSYITGFDLPTVSSRIIPFIEALSPISMFFLARYMYDETAAYISTLALALTPTFVFWTGITDPQSLTLFLIPLYILLWLKHSKEPNNRNLAIVSVVLTVNFLVHLSYFVAVFILFSISTVIVFRKIASKWLFRDLLIVVLLSQILTAPWWLPKNLYWWWIKALVTSSGLYSATWQIGDFGVVAVVLGVTSMIYLASTKGNWKYIILFWALPLFIESQNEAILFTLNRVDLTWTTLAKPLEGFRFFPFLAQPIALSVGALASSLENSRVLSEFNSSKVQALMVFLLTSTFLWGIISIYQIDIKFQTSGLTPGEYNAAVWYRENSKGDSRIAADYYRAQMLSGVTGGKALDGGMFPLRNVKFPYISVPATVQDDLYLIYTSKDPSETHRLVKRYGLTHVFYSLNMAEYGNLLSNYRPASEYGIPINLEKFNDPEYFRLIYEDETGTMIFEVV